MVRAKTGRAFSLNTATPRATFPIATHPPGVVGTADNAGHLHPTPANTASITGSLAIDDRYRVDIQDSIVDAGIGVGDPAGPLAIGPATDPADGWGAPLNFHGMTCFGGVRVTEEAQA